MKFISLLSILLLINIVISAEPNPPQWPSNVFVLDPDNPTKSQNIIDQIYATNGGHNPAFNGQFVDYRYALLFKPGIHTVNVKIGYYTSVIGLGVTPNDTNIQTVTIENGDFDYTGGALSNFWRSAENFYTKPTTTWNNSPTPSMMWAVSQACPLRRVVVDGDLTLFQYNSGCCAGYSSGGYLSDSIVTGSITSGSQQQWITRNTKMGSWVGGNWNMVFVGNQGGPGSHCSNVNGSPYTTTEQTPVIAEKPYISLGSNGKYTLVIPNVETNKVGPTTNFQNARFVDFSSVYVAEESDSASLINQKLASGLHVVLSPGNYNLTDPIVVGNNNTVVLGIGFPTLISATGNPVLTVTASEGVRVSGILLQAGPVKTGSLLIWGKNDTGNANNPGFLYDCFGRVGGTNNPAIVQLTADTILTVAQGYLVVDNTWFWRADHGISGEVYNGDNPNDHGLKVFSDNVVIYGLAVEHQLNNLVEWFGENGRVYFYQSELPYDVTQENFADKGYTSVNIASNVQKFSGNGFGIYSYFRDHTVTVNSAIVTGSSNGISFVNSNTVFLNGNGGINHIVNNQGASSNSASHVNYLCSYNSMLNNKTLVIE